MIPWAARHKHQSESSTHAFKIIFGVDAGIINSEAVFFENSGRQKPNQEGNALGVIQGGF